jgi:hypothetical protein
MRVMLHWYKSRELGTWASMFFQHEGAPSDISWCDAVLESLLSPFRDCPWGPAGFATMVARPQPPLLSYVCVWRGGLWKILLMNTRWTHTILLHHILDATTCINDWDTSSGYAFSFKWARICMEADSGYFEHIHHYSTSECQPSSG